MEELSVFPWLQFWLKLFLGFKPGQVFQLFSVFQRRDCYIQHQILNNGFIKVSNEAFKILNDIE